VSVQVVECDLGLSSADRLRREQHLLGLVNDWQEMEPNGYDNTNYELPLRTGRPLGAADFLEQAGAINRYEFAAQEGRLAQGQEREMGICPRKFRCPLAFCHLFSFNLSLKPDPEPLRVSIHRSKMQSKCWAWLPLTF